MRRWIMMVVLCTPGKRLSIYHWTLYVKIIFWRFWFVCHRTEISVCINYNTNVRKQGDQYGTHYTQLCTWIRYSTLINFRHRPTFIQRFIFKVNIRTRKKYVIRDMWRTNVVSCNEGSVVAFSERVIDWSPMTRNGDWV